VKVLVTGGAGFIGSNYVRKVVRGELDKIDSVIVIDKLTYAGTLTNFDHIPRNSFEFIEGDICDIDLVSKLVSKVDAVINFAAESHVDRSISSASDFISTNVMGVLVILDAIKNNAKEVRLLQVSTDEVYGSIESGSWSETQPLMPNSPYSASKASAELLARSYIKTHGLDVVVTRCSNNYGPNHFPEKLIPLFITNILENKKVPVYGSGLNVRDWLHVDDHCEALHKVLLTGASGSIYNIGGGAELSNLEITHKILEIMGSPTSSIEFVADRKGHDFRYSVDWTKIKTDLSYKPKVDFNDGLLKTIDWYKENVEWWKPLKGL
jgi:dTDP-glucose 4,6-dehydratase